jgi:hypothetical protein
LLGVAVGRARRLGRGDNITRVNDRIISITRGPLATVRLYNFEMPVLIPELADVCRALDGFEKLKRGLLEVVRAEGLYYNNYGVKLELLPLELRIALKKVFETAVTAILNSGYFRQIREDIGALLAACNPGTVELEVYAGREVGVPGYHILYTCKPHTDGELKLRIFWRFWNHEYCIEIYSSIRQAYEER